MKIHPLDSLRPSIHCIASYATLAFALAIVTAATHPALAAPPESLTYQGVVLDDAGRPRAGEVEIEVGIWPDPEKDGQPLYHELHTAVELLEGIFTIRIGEGTPTGEGESDVLSEVFDGAKRWLEISVDGERLTPRQRFGSVAFALHCGSAEAARHAMTCDEALSVVGVPGEELARTEDVDSLQQELQTLYETVRVISDEAQICGDGIMNPGEACDGADFGGTSCVGLGYLGGSLACKSDCVIDPSACVSAVCGDDLVGPGEECDGANLDGKTCTTLGFESGTLACVDCNFDTTSCVSGPVLDPTCTDGRLMGNGSSGATCGFNAGDPGLPSLPFLAADEVLYNELDTGSGFAKGCGACFEITGALGSVVAMVKEICDVGSVGAICAGTAYSRLLIPEDVIATIGGGSADQPGAFRRVPCPVTGNIHVMRTGWSTQGAFALHPYAHRHPIATMSWRQAGPGAIASPPWNDFIERSWTNRFEQPYQGNPLPIGDALAVELRIESVDGHVVVSDPIPIPVLDPTPSGVNEFFDTGVQFPESPPLEGVCIAPES